METSCSLFFKGLGEKEVGEQIQQNFIYIYRICWFMLQGKQPEFVTIQSISQAAKRH